MPNPWDRFERNPIPDQDEEAIFTAVGRAATAWERLDQVIALLFSTIVGSDRGGAEAAYGTITSAKTRSELLLAAMEAVFDPPTELNSEIAAFLREVGQLSGRRNDIIHGLVMNFQAGEERLGCYLVPPYFHTRKHHKKPQAAADADSLTWMASQQKYAFTAEQVNAYAAVFDEYRQKGVDLLRPTYDRKREILTA